MHAARMTDDILDSRRDLAADAARDLESTGKRLSSASEHQRERLLAVLTERHRRLQHRRRGREPMVA
jgi:hypothetical protein